MGIKYIKGFSFPEDNTIYKIETDKTLSLEGEPADAKEVKRQIDQLGEWLDSYWVNMTPQRGQVIMTVDGDFSPSQQWGGIWEKMEDRFLIGASSSYPVGSTGGESTVSLTIEEIPRHSHSTFSEGLSRPDGSQASDFKAGITKTTMTGFWTEERPTKSGINSTGGQIDPDGTIHNQARGHNNMPPYYAVYMWKRLS